MSHEHVPRAEAVLALQPADAGDDVEEVVWVAGGACGVGGAGVGGGGGVGREAVVEGGEGGDVRVREEVGKGGEDGAACLEGVAPGAAVEVAGGVGWGVSWGLGVEGGG